MRDEKSRLTGRHASFIFLPFVLAACTATPERALLPTDHLHLLALEEIAQALTGSYSNHLQWQDQPATDPGPFRLEIREQPSGDMQWFRLRFTQSAPGEQTQRYLLEVTPGASRENFEGLFVPVDAAGNTLPNTCTMVFTLLSAGFSGEVSADGCQIDKDEEPVRVIREIAFDGQQIITVYQQHEPLTRRFTGEPQVLHFFRERRFRGWATVGTGPQTHPSAGLILHVDGGEVTPKDASGRDLGIRLQLSRVVPMDDQSLALHLSVHDARTGRLLGQAWADAAATQIGINLPGVKASFTAIPE